MQPGSGVLSLISGLVKLPAWHCSNDDGENAASKQAGDGVQRMTGSRQRVPGSLTGRNDRRQGRYAKQQKRCAASHGRRVLRGANRAPLEVKTCQRPRATLSIVFITHFKIR